MSDNPHNLKAHELHILMSTMGRVSKTAVTQALNALNMDISPLMFGVLMAVNFESLTITELSRHFSVDPSTLVPSVDALERKGLVERGRDPNDRRRVPLSLTPEGKKIVACIPHARENDPIMTSLEAMGPAKVDQLIHLMRELVRLMPDGEELITSVDSRLSMYVQRYGLNQQEQTHAEEESAE